VAVVGCGAQGRVHLSLLSRLPDVEIAAVCERDPTRLAAATREFGVRRGFPDYVSLLQDDPYDLVTICLMPVFHREVTLAALRRGAHVLCEKPFAMDAVEAGEMVAAARAADRILTVGTNMRFLENARYIKRLVDAGELGRPVYTRAWTYAGGIPWWGPHYVRAISGGGALASTAVHILDCALFLADFPTPVSVSGMTARLYPIKRGGTAPPGVDETRYDVDDHVSAFIRFADGSALTLEGTFTHDGPRQPYSLELIGTRGTARLDPLAVYVDRNGQPIDVTPAEAPGADWRDSIRAELADVLGAIREHRAPSITPEQGLLVQRISDAIYRSAVTGHEVRLATA
jgi:predicted dehydrogenase